jgi:hypothetical protein
MHFRIKHSVEDKMPFKRKIASGMKR